MQAVVRVISMAFLPPSTCQKVRLTILGAGHQKLPHHAHTVRIDKAAHGQRRVARPGGIHSLVVGTVTPVKRTFLNCRCLDGHMKATVYSDGCG